MLVQSFTEPYGPAEAIHDPKLCRCGPSGGHADEQTAVIRAEIDGCKAIVTFNLAAADLRPVGLLNSNDCHILAFHRRVWANESCASSIFFGTTVTIAVWPVATTRHPCY